MSRIKLNKRVHSLSCLTLARTRLGPFGGKEQSVAIGRQLAGGDTKRDFG